MPQWCTPTYAPPYSCASVYSWRFGMLWGVVRAPFYVKTLPLHHPYWGASPSFAPPHSVVGSLCIGMFRGYQYVMWAFSLLLRGLGVFPISWGWGISNWDVHMLILVHFCSALCLLSTTARTTTPLVTVVSSGLSSVSSVTVAPSHTGFAVSLDQHGVVPPPPLMPKGSGGVLGSVPVPQQQTPSSMPLLAYANHAMGSPQVGFFFRAEPPTILYIICLVSILVSAFSF